MLIFSGTRVMFCAFGGLLFFWMIFGFRLRISCIFFVTGFLVVVVFFLLFVEPFFLLGLLFFFLLVYLDTNLLKFVGVVSSGAFFCC